jgi:hypothetical protein
MGHPVEGKAFVSRPRLALFREVVERQEKAGPVSAFFISVGVTHFFPVFGRAPFVLA